MHREEEVDNLLPLMRTDIQGITRECERTTLLLEDLKNGAEAVERAQGSAKSYRLDSFGQRIIGTLPDASQIPHRNLVKEVTKAVKRAVKRGVYPADIKDIAAQPWEDHGDFNDDSEDEEKVEEIDRDNSRRLRSADQSGKDGKTEEKFERFRREERYRTGPWTRPKGPLFASIVDINLTNHLYAHVVNDRTCRIRFTQRIAVVSSAIMNSNVDNLKCQLQDTIFTGLDHKTIILFLTEFSGTCDELELSE